ncbi:MAG TPA: hypothetical protein VK681_27485 [Reyranella sp.]|nr:hypothetical protein [Reyranella sp.]
MEQTEAVLGSLRAHITGDMKAKRASTVEKVAVPRFNGRLILRCRTMSDRDLLRLSLDAQEADDQVEGLIDAGITALLNSCEGCETDQVDAQGSPVDLGRALGLELSTYLGEEAGCGQAQDDREAVVEIFGGEADIVETANKLGQLQARANSRIAEDTVGNSGAAS